MHGGSVGKRCGSSPSTWPLTQHLGASTAWRMARLRPALRPPPKQRAPPATSPANGSEGWEFESLRARPNVRSVPHGGLAAGRHQPLRTVTPVAPDGHHDPTTAETDNMLRQLAEAMSGLGANNAVDYALRAAAAATAQLGFEEDARHCEAALELADDRRGEIARTARAES